MIDRKRAGDNQMEQSQIQEAENMPAVKTWQGQRVVSFKDIDAAHQRPEGTARKAFARNRKRFIKDVDYFIITKSEFLMSIKRTLENQKSIKDTLENFRDIPNRGLTVLTESGYLMVVKPFTDDLSWEVQRRLVNTYFKASELMEHVEKQTRTEMVRLLPEFKGGNIEDKQLAAEFIQDYIVEKQDDAGLYRAYIIWCMSNNRTFLPAGFFQRVKNKVVELRLKTGEWKPYTSRVQIQGGSR